MHQPRLVAVLIVLAMALVAIQSAAAAAPPVKVTLKDFKVVPAAKAAKAGSVTFSVKNTGAVAHELVVAKATGAPNAFPVKGDKAAVKAIGQATNIGPGASKTLTVKLAAGKYVLLCNVKGHYKLGQFSAFAVN